MKTPTPPYNGWIIVNNNQLFGSYAKNYHVVEAHIVSDIYGHRKYDSRARKTLCGEHLLATINYQYGPYYSWEADKMRNKLAELQNTGLETCGTCVSEFYADK